MLLARFVRGRPWRADGYTDRPGGPDAVRYTSVDTATHRLTVTPEFRVDLARPDLALSGPSGAALPSRGTRA
jgi:hypothetical protein